MVIKMKKNLKILSLIFLMQLLCGWSWKDIDNTNNINKSTCSYKAQNESGAFIPAFYLEKNENSLSVTYIINNVETTKTIVTNKSTSMQLHDLVIERHVDGFGDGNVGTRYINWGDYLAKDKTLCPNTIYVKQTDNVIGGVGIFDPTNYLYFYNYNDSSANLVYKKQTNGQNSDGSDSNPEIIYDQNVDKAQNEDNKCVYRDNYNNVIGLNIMNNNLQGQIYLLFGNERNESISLNKSNWLDENKSSCPDYFYYTASKNYAASSDFEKLKEFAQEDKEKYNAVNSSILTISTKAPVDYREHNDPTYEENFGNNFQFNEELGDAENVKNPDTVEGMDICSQNGVRHVLHIFGYLVFALKIAVPLLLVIMGSMDFAKALVDSDDKAMKDALAKLIKRIIAGIIIFFLPTIFNFLLGLIDGVSENQTNFTGCSNCLFTPFDGNCSYTKLGEN